MSDSDKFRQMEDEMSRFEAEISIDPSSFAGAPVHLRPVIGSNTYSQVQQRLLCNPPLQQDYTGSASIIPQSMGFPLLSSYGTSPPPPMLIPHQLRTTKGQQTSILSQHQNIQSSQAQRFMPPAPPVYSSDPILISQPVVVTSAPKLYSKPSTVKKINESIKAKEKLIIPKIDVKALEADIAKKLRQLKPDKNVISVAPTNPIAEAAISQGKASSALQSFGQDDRPKREKKNKKLIRTAGGQTWEDSSLQDWEDDDFRIFCGDLGNDVTDELLIRTFNKYPSFLKAKVIRDKRTNKSKGFGFVSFKDPADFIKAMKEMDGRYVGSRPIKLRKSCWKNRSLEVVRKKEKEKAVLLNLLTSNSNR